VVSDPVSPVRHRSSERVARRWRNKTRVLDWQSPRSDEHLPFANIADVVPLARRIGDEDALKTLDQPNRDRAVLHPSETLLRCHDVVENLSQLERQSSALFRLGGENGFERRVRALEGTRALRLAAECGSAQKRGFGKLLRCLVETSERGFGRSNLPPGRRARLDSSRQRVWNVREVLELSPC